MSAIHERVERRVLELKRQSGETLTLEQLAVYSGARVCLTRRMVEDGLIEPVSADRPSHFATESLALVKKALRLHYDLGVGWNSMPLVMKLLDRVSALEERLDKLDKA